MATYRILKAHSGAHDRFGLDVHEYQLGQVVPLPDHLGIPWVASGIAEVVPEAEEPKAVAPTETKPAAPASIKIDGEDVPLRSVKRTPIVKKRR